VATPDVALISPFPDIGERHGGWTGVASYSASLASALADEGADVIVLASQEPGLPETARRGSLEVRRVWKRGAGALPTAAAAARATGAPTVHVQHELFLYGGPVAVPGVVPALGGLRASGRDVVVTMHHVVDPGAIDAAFTQIHRVKAPVPVARAGVRAVQGAVRTLADAIVVHEPAFADLVPGANVVPHGVESPEPIVRDAARAALGVREDVLCVLCFGFLAPYKGLEAAIDAAGIAGPGVELVIAGGEHPRLKETGDDYAGRLRASAPPNARFTGYVPDADVGRWFAAADVALFPYPQPFATSGPLALALAHGTPVLLSDALVRTMGAPFALRTELDPAALADRLSGLAADPAARRELADAAALMAAGRGWPEVGRRHLEIYQEVAA
jgi:glycosyltransferase involved in cell wall biosynthesis